jgi:hypothetical protein
MTSYHYRGEPEANYRAFIASIDTSVCGRDEYGDLRWHIECSAEGNAGDMLTGQTFDTDYDYEDALYTAALATARDCADDWRSMYPQLAN